MSLPLPAFSVYKPEWRLQTALRLQQLQKKYLHQNEVCPDCSLRRFGCRFFPNHLPIRTWLGPPLRLWTPFGRCCPRCLCRPSRPNWIRSCHPWIPPHRSPS